MQNACGVSRRRFSVFARMGTCKPFDIIPTQSFPLAQMSYNTKGFSIFGIACSANHSAYCCGFIAL
jgi:hypothetical protein